MAEADVVIRTEHLGKYYRLGVMHKDRLVDVISHAWNKVTGQGNDDAPGNPAAHADHIWALRDANIEIRRGDVVGLIGRNGAGKSTLLKILTGVTKPTTGRAWMKGRLGSLLEVGTGFHPELTGRENIFLNGTILGMRTREVHARLDEIIAFAGLDDFIDTPVKRYSSGMYMRLAFSVAAHLEPEILLVDEVLAVGDAEFQKKCLGKMEDVAHHGRTVVFVSHNLYALQSLCRRGILLENGTVTMAGDLPAVLNRYLQNADTKGGEITWPEDKAPGDLRVRLRAVRVVSGGQTTDTVDIAQGFDVEIEYDYLKPDQGCLVCLHINSALGQWLVHTDAFQETTLTGTGSRSLGPGRYLTRCHVPGKLLNDGQYSLSVFINFRGHGDTAVSMRNVLNFHLQEDGYLRAEVQYMGPWTSLLRPKFEWDTEPVK